MTEKRLRFEPGARSIIQMGEELIGHPTTAINEIVKNGYDADATTVRVYINYNKDKSKSFLVIADNGLGMDSDTLFGSWLQPSVSSKRNGSGKSKVFERSLLGSKGIGRLAAMALGEYLTVISKTSTENNYNWLVLSRDNFKKESLLSAISFPGGSESSIKDILENNEAIKEKNKTVNSDILKWLNSRN